jgi:hypothetical protein
MLYSTFRIRLFAASLVTAAAVFAFSPTTTSAQDSAETKALVEAFKLEPMGLDSDLKKIEEQWKVLESHIKDEKYMKIRAGKVSRWSMGQQVMHCAKVVSFIGGEMQKLLDNPYTGVNEEAKPILSQVLGPGEIPRGRGQAPAPVAVHFQPTMEQIQAEMKNAREVWAKIEARKKDVETSKAKYPHFALGPMTAADWTRFIAIHTAHHLKIMNDILAENAKTKTE